MGSAPKIGSKPTARRPLRHRTHNVQSHRTISGSGALPDHHLTFVVDFRNGGVVFVLRHIEATCTWPDYYRARNVNVCWRDATVLGLLKLAYGAKYW